MQQTDDLDRLIRVALESQDENQRFRAKRTLFGRGVFVLPLEVEPSPAQSQPQIVAKGSLRA